VGGKDGVSLIEDSLPNVAHAKYLNQ
jgi:hypothetical protein